MPTTKPITPAEVIKTKMPNEVFEAFNEIITANFANGRSQFHQKEVASLIVDKMIQSGRDQVGKGNKARSILTADVYGNHWLDVEDYYRAVGWDVKIEKPDPGESHEPFFVFKTKVQPSPRY